ncbi:MAG TPA: hypothetical protein VHF92_17265 [Geodermatophilus sp.]|nr:hypothetical protein [Geodermatophilus sp.]
MSSSTRPTRRLRWRTAAAGALIAAASFTTAACGQDVVDDGVQEDVEQGVEDAEREVEEGAENLENEVDGDN